MRGWVYLMTNRAMPGLVQVGYSTKDPEARALELNTTGVPHPYSVAFEVLVHRPRDVERKAHRILKACREGKEWFRCSLQDAMYAVKRAAEGSIAEASSTSTLTIVGSESSTRFADPAEKAKFVDEVLRIVRRRATERGEP